MTTTNPAKSDQEPVHAGFTVPKAKTDKLPTLRPGAVAHPHLHRADVHPLSAVVQLLVEEAGFSTSTAEGLTDQFERWLHDAMADEPSYPPRNVAAIAAQFKAAPKPKLEAVQGGLTDADVQARIDQAVQRATAETNAKLDALLKLVGGPAPKPVDATPEPTSVGGEPPPIDSEPPGGPPRPGEG